jgi:MFS transporter, SHS family, sialic acid transporter
MNTSPVPLSETGRRIILVAAIAGLLFDGLELGMMPVASMSVTESLVGPSYTSTIGGVWFAYYTASLMLGAAIGGIVLGRLGDTIGRSRALGVSILFYSLFAGLGAWVQSQEQMLVLRFMVGLGVGGVWPNAVALAAECWPNRSRPIVAGLLGAALNGGVLLLSIVARNFPITAESWRWLFGLAALPALLGFMVLLLLPESPSWLALRLSRNDPASNKPTLRKEVLVQLFTPPMLRITLLAIVLGSVPLVGAWAASKWMIPWADSISKVEFPGYKAQVQSWWAIGATLGSFTGAQIAGYLGRRRAYTLISIGATLLTLLMFLGTRPLHASFLPIVFAQGFVTTLFFGWLPLYLPQMFPTEVRATGSGIAFNTGRFATAIGVLMVGFLFGAVKAFPIVGACGALIYALGVIAILFLSDEQDPTSSTAQNPARL